MFLSALAEPTKVPLTQEVQGEHIDEVRSVDGEKNFFLIFFVLIPTLPTFIDFTEFRRVSRPLKALEGTQKIWKISKNLAKSGKKFKSR